MSKISQKQKRRKDMIDTKLATVVISVLSDNSRNHIDIFLFVLGNI